MDRLHPLVRWAGWKASWERWRANKPLYPGHAVGERGEPVETWVKEEELEHTAALSRWRAAMALAGRDLD